LAGIRVAARVATAPVLRSGAAPGRAVLAADARLASPISLAWKDRPLGDVLPNLGQRLNTVLAAGRTVADDKVTAFLDGRPAAEALAILADHLNMRWKKTPGGYELGQDPAQRQREADLRKLELSHQYARLQARMDRVAALAALPAG